MSKPSTAAALSPTARVPFAQRLHGVPHVKKFAGKMVVTGSLLAVNANPCQQLELPDDVT
jgi:hypothetical protein